jgi:hypothetical protein
MSREHDAPKRTTRTPPTPGQIPPGRYGVFDARGNLRAHVGVKASAVTASRFTKRAMKLGKMNGRPAWVCDGR